MLVREIVRSPHDQTHLSLPSYYWVERVGSTLVARARPATEPVPPDLAVKSSSEVSEGNSVRETDLNHSHNF